MKKKKVEPSDVILWCEIKGCFNDGSWREDVHTYLCDEHYDWLIKT